MGAAGSFLFGIGAMLYGFFNRVSSAGSLKASLDASTRRTRSIADRVANASLQNRDGFAMPGIGGTQAGAAAGPQGAAEGGPVDLETEMVSLADEQLRFEATAKLLEKTYQQIRVSIRDR